MPTEFWLTKPNLTILGEPEAEEETAAEEA